MDPSEGVHSIMLAPLGCHIRLTIPNKDNKGKILMNTTQHIKPPPVADAGRRLTAVSDEVKVTDD